MRRLNTINIILFLILVYTSITVGVAHFSWLQVDEVQRQLQLLLVSRIPRTMAVILTGASLSVAGMVLQIVLKNRFLDPSLIGATQSATVGILFMSLVFPAATLLIKMTVATGFAVIGMGLFLLLLSRLPPQQKLLVPLVGIIYGSIITAGVTFVALETDTIQLLGSWFSGDFSDILQGRYELLWITAGLVVVIYILADQLTIAGMGKALSTSLGINYQRTLWITLILVALISAMEVVTIGEIPFIGLVVPNIVSRLSGDRLRHNLPSVVLLGANLLLICDIVGRIINQPYEIPASLIFGILGTGVFLYLLVRSPRAV